MKYLSNTDGWPWQWRIAKNAAPLSTEGVEAQNIILILRLEIQCKLEGHDLAKEAAPVAKVN